MSPQLFAEIQAVPVRQTQIENEKIGQRLPEQLERFGTGFMRLALETNTPITPIAVIGSEEQYPSIANLKDLATSLDVPAVPIIPQLLLGMPLPLPVKYRLFFGEPMHFEGDPDDDDAVIDEKVQRVRAEIQRMVNLGLEQREKTGGVFG